MAVLYMRQLQRDMSILIGAWVMYVVFGLQNVRRKQS